jgi:hypothetical protein
MVDVVNIFGDPKGMFSLKCEECGTYGFFLFPDNTAKCVSCDTEYTLIQLGPLHLSKPK